MDMQTFLKEIDETALFDKEQRIVDQDNALVIGPVRDMTTHLTPRELNSIKSAVPKRRHQFSTGRYYARQGLKALGLGLHEITKCETGKPIWPDNVRGSISHTDDLVVAMVSNSDHYLAFGIDVEKRNAVSSEIYDFILTDREKLQLETEPLADTATLIFSAKESIYKALSQIEAYNNDFLNLEIFFDDGHTRFTACFTPKQKKKCTSEVITALSRGQGFIRNLRGHILTLYAAPASTAAGKPRPASNRYTLFCRGEMECRRSSKAYPKPLARCI